MAAKVGGVVVDLVANTAQFEEQMKKASDTMAGIGAYASESAYNKSKADDKATMSTQRYMEATRGLQLAIGNAGIAMAAGNGVVNRYAGNIFRLKEYYAVLATKAAESAEALRKSNAAMYGGVTAGGMLAKTLGLMTIKIAAIAAAMWAAGKAFKMWQDYRKDVKLADKATQEYRDHHATLARDMYEAMTTTREPIDKLVAKLKSGAVNAEEWAKEVGKLARAHLDLKKAAEIDKSWKAIDDVFQSIEERSRAIKVNLITGTDLSDYEVSVRSIYSAYAEMAKKAKEIADEKEREKAIAVILKARDLEFAQFEKNVAAEKAKEARKEHNKRMKELQEMAKQISEMFGKRAELAIGWGADVWKAIQDTLGNDRVRNVETKLLRESGALDEDSKKALLEMRDYLFQLLRQEAVSI